jgi:hypothetical protein
MRIVRIQCSLLWFALRTETVYFFYVRTVTLIYNIIGTCPNSVVGFFFFKFGAFFLLKWRYKTWKVTRLGMCFLTVHVLQKTYDFRVARNVRYQDAENPTPTSDRYKLENLTHSQSIVKAYLLVVLFDVRYISDCQNIPICQHAM